MSRYVFEDGIIYSKTIDQKEVKCTFFEKVSALAFQKYQNYYHKFGLGDNQCHRFQCSQSRVSWYHSEGGQKEVKCTFFGKVSALAFQKYQNHYHKFGLGDNQCHRFQCSRQGFGIIRSSQHILGQSLKYLFST